MRFYLGTHMASWLWREEFRRIPLFIAYSCLRGRRSTPTVAGPWALDSGGFSQLSKYPDGWPPGCEEGYVSDVRRFAEQMSGMEFAAQQDWMCEPWLLHGRTIREHQERTVRNYARLVELAPDLPWLPVLQGWKLPDYHDCLDMFSDAGFELDHVGVGSVCRRQSTVEVQEIMESLHEKGLRIHGFGVKTEGLQKYGPSMSSTDSLAWSYTARREKLILPGCHHGVHGTGNCANCPVYARSWRVDLLMKLGM